MDTNVVIYIFGGFLFLFIIIHYYRQYSSHASKENKGPKRIRPQCPVYWVQESNGKCRNVHKLGRCLTRGERGGLMDFSGDYFQNRDSGNYAKCKFARNCGISWDGIDSICI